MTFLKALTLVFIITNLTDQTDISWWLVWIPAACSYVANAVIYAVAGTAFKSQDKVSRYNQVLRK